MAELNPKPNSSTKLQHQRLAIVASRQGFDIHQARKLVGGSVCKLSAAECSKWIKHFSGQDLPNPPGRKPRAYKGKPTPGTTRMIKPDQIQQIDRLGYNYFGRDDLYYSWLYKNFNVRDPYDLATAKRAGQVIRVLKQMLARRVQKRDREYGAATVRERT